MFHPSAPEVDVPSQELEKKAEVSVLSETPQTNIAQEIVVPDGGARAWLTLLGGWLVLFSTLGYSISFGVYQDLYVVAGASTSSNISWIGSLQQLFLMYCVGFPAGKWFDEGYFHYTQLVGSVLYVFSQVISHRSSTQRRSNFYSPNSFFMLSLADPTKYYQLILSQGIGAGLGSGLLVVPSLSVQAHHWKKRRALAMGLAFTGSAVGGVIYPIMLNRLFDGGAGFQWGVRATAFLTLGLLWIANCVMTTRLPSVNNRVPGPKADIWSILKDGPYMLAIFGSFLVFLGLFFPAFYLQLWVTLHNLSPTLAFYTVAIMNAGSMLGRTGPNMAADIFGHLNVTLPITLILCGLVFAMYGVKSTGAVIIFSILYGCISGAFVSLVPPLMAAFARDLDEIGVRIGLCYFIISFAILTGTPITGALLSSKDQWSRPIIFSGVRGTVAWVWF
ncbi:MFS general substrate transporter [Amylocystis lapponica]|nr:MFS general substrate transporter [Amylocystis lapponica]